MTAAPDIFLSYNREDQVVARRFAEAFEAEGFSVWWDVTLRSGEAYDQVTEEALRSAKAVVVLWSKQSVVSRWVRAEATLADRNRTLAPARIEPCDLPIMFELTQTADLAHWQGEAHDPAWRAFLADVRRFVGVKDEPTPAAVLPVAAAQPLRGKRASIAVLPFINRSGLAEDDIFADGMVEDLTTALSVSRKMRVIAASATAAYRTGARDLRQIGHELGVRYLLEGNVRRVGSDFRVTAQLVEAEDGDIIWTQKFDRPLADIATLQEHLVTEVAARLGAEVQRSEIEHALRKPGDITAWEAMLRADAHVSRQTPAGYEAAIAEARHAIAIDPDYDLAHATLVMAMGTLAFVRGNDDPVWEAALLEAVARAKLFDSQDPIVLARIAIGLSSVGRDRDALPYAERAVSINPNLENPHIALGAILVGLGRSEEALVECEAAMRLAPNGIWLSASQFQQALAHFQAGRFERSLDLIEKGLRLAPYLPAQIHRVVCLMVMDRHQAAAEALRVFRQDNPDWTPFAATTQLRRILFRGMDPALVEDYLTRLQRLWDETPA